MSSILDPGYTLRTKSGQPGSNRFYIALLPAYAGYAVPTDFWGLRGAAGKLLTVRICGMLVNQTTAAKLTMNVFKRAALNTNGTPTVVTPAKYDNRDPAASGVFQVYTALPTINDGAPKTIAPVIGFAAVLTAAPTNFNINGTGLSTVNSPIQDECTSLIIKENEELVLNFGGAALPAGFLGVPFAQWAEYDV